MPENQPSPSQIKKRFDKRCPFKSGLRKQIHYYRNNPNADPHAFPDAAEAIGNALP